jgi:peptidoglycan hydrolase CwlO-like protein
MATHKLEITHHDHVNLSCALATRVQRVDQMIEIYKNDQSVLESYLEEKAWLSRMRQRLDEYSSTVD